METAAPERSRMTAALILAAVIVAIMAGTMLFVARPWVPAPVPETQPPTAAPTQPPTEPPTEEPTEPPTEPEPTEPPTDLNPYGIFDFQYAGRYLKLLEGESITGIDVSAHQQEVDWVQVKESGVEFVMIRLGYRGYGEAGTLNEDKYARENLKGAAAAGLDIGVYFFSQAISVEEALEEADFVLEMLNGMELAMPVVYDWEFVSDTARTAGMDRRTLTDCSLAFLGKIEEAGYEPMLYFNTNQARKLLYLQELEQYDFWLALYSHRMTFPYKIKMWQYTCTGSVPGITGNCDINIYFPDPGN